jgi:hypothetical protein
MIHEKCDATYLSQNIHLHVVVPVTTPLRIGPITPATAIVKPRILTTKCRYFGGAISGQMTIASEYRPVPPMPCKVLNRISWSTFWEKPQAREKHVKKKKEVRRICLLPNTSASLVKNTAHPMSANMYDKAAQIVWR